MSEDERRRTPRRSVDFPVTLDDSGNAIEGTVRDLSAGGCFVLAASRFEPGTLVVISAADPEADGFTFGAKVVRRGEDAEGGMGLQFTDVGPAALIGLRRQLVAGMTVRVEKAGSGAGESESE